MDSVKFYLVGIIFFVATFSACAEEVFTEAVPLEADKAFVIDYIVAGSNEVVVRLQISENYYLYKERFIFSSIDFYIDDVNLPPAKVKNDEFFGLSEVYFNVMETTLQISPKISGNSSGILEVAYQGCWEGGVCYPLTRKYLQIRGL